MRRLRLTTAGESHGPGLTAILEGLPAGLTVDFALLEREMARRQHGYGRGRRMQIERDRAEIRGGVRDGETIGSPLALWIANRDYETWRRAMAAAPEEIDRDFVELRRLRSPRPGHVDLAGGQKYLRRDLRDLLERASARESAARVAAGAFAKMLLAELGVEIRSGVRSLGPIGADTPIPGWDEISAVDDASPLRAIDRGLEPRMVALVDEAKAQGETLGGSATVVAHGVPPGLGSHVQWSEKLDGRIAQAMLSVPAVKAVEIGAAIAAARDFGSRAHDAIEYSPERGFTRPTNRAGGVEAGITNGEDVVVTLYKKPISTLREGLPSVDLDTLAAHRAQYERSDVTALPAAGVIGEAMLALVLADACLEKFGGDSLAELLAHFEASRELVRRWPGRAGASDR
ncbi:MAG TPA: chorismate synthase [Thermoanaerobaculia bacterium]|nr:chorismate synthase [Thermoanaerobaculia bacterium]